jgi:hypothetical protein
LTVFLAADFLAFFAFFAFFAICHYSHQDLKLSISLCDSVAEMLSN